MRGEAHRRDVGRFRVPSYGSPSLTSEANADRKAQSPDDPLSPKYVMECYALVGSVATAWASFEFTIDTLHLPIS